MRYKEIDSEYIIRGSCPLFACRCCHTKYGWEHQGWCEEYRLTSPTCRDCLYFSERHGKCKHPAQRKERQGASPHEKDDLAVRAG